jgi:preprotein translocase subunit SecA
MLKGLIGRVFGTRHERERKRVQPVLNDIHEIEARLASLTDDEIRAQTAKFRGVLAERTGHSKRELYALLHASETEAT